MVLHIARFAYRAGYHAHWVQFCNDEEIAVALDVTDTSHVTRLSCMVSSKTYYVEVRFSYAWWGTGLDILALAGLAQPEGQRKFRFMLEHNDGVGGHDNGHIAVLERNVVGDMLDMPSLGVDSWSYCQDPVTMSVLVDMVRGCVTFGLNGLAGPCVRFPADDTWRSGVQVVARNFPLLAPMDGGRSQGRCIVSCATPPTPPSMLAAASHPRTVSEHLAAGSLRTPTPPVGGGIDWGGVD